MVAVLEGQTVVAVFVISGTFCMVLVRMSSDDFPNRKSCRSKPWLKSFAGEITP